MSKAQIKASMMTVLFGLCVGLGASSIRIGLAAMCGAAIVFFAFAALWDALDP